MAAGQTRSNGAYIPRQRNYKQALPQSPRRR
nr:MAG TPA: hypothetical protein [Caudoviricetes sp.]